MDTRAPKRQKVATACDPYRGRKVKCDGHQPVCGPCEKRSKSVSCTWATDFLHAPSASADYIKRLEDRIKLLEANNSQGSQIRTNIISSSNSTSGNSLAETISSHRATTSASPASASWLSTVSWEEYPSMNTPEMSANQWQSNSAAAISPRLVPSFQELSKSIDNTCASSDLPTHNIVFDQNHETIVIDKPSAQSFMQKVEKLVTEKIGEASTSTSDTLGFYINTASSAVPNYGSLQRDLDYILPTREQADSLLTSYFDNVHFSYPFLDKMGLQEEYEKIWSCENYTTDQGSRICLINSVFAISSRQTKTTVSTHENMAAIFCRRAQGFLNIPTRSIRSVQSYLNLALYFQSTGQSRTCWLCVGNAIRIVQMLELDLSETSERIDKSQARESLRKAWHSCVIMDREVQMLYGRPSMIDPQAAAAIPLHLLAEEDNYHLRHNEGNIIETPQTYTADFYKSCLELYDILYAVFLDSRRSKSDTNVIKGQYTSDNISSPGTNVSILRLQEELSKWEQENPNHLRLEKRSTHSNLSAVQTRRAAFLHQRYLHIQLLLLTPVLQQLIGTESQNKSENIPLGSVLSHRISQQCAIVCVEIAQEAIDTIYLRETSGSNEISAWWCNVIFLYKSATVLIAGGLCPSVVAEISEASIHESFDKATAILRQYTAFNSSILRLVTVLDILFQIVPQKFSRLKKASQRVEAGAGLSTPDDGNSAVTFQYWCPIKPIRHAASAQQDAVSSNPENNGSSQILTDLDRLFDTNDFTWLTKMPFNT